MKMKIKNRKIIAFTALVFSMLVCFSLGIINMETKSVKAETPFTVESITTFDIKDGASVRINKDGHNGLRYCLNMSKAEYDGLMNNVGTGKTYSEVNFGVIIAPAEYDKTNPLNEENLFGKNSVYDWTTRNEQGEWVNPETNKIQVINLYSNTMIDENNDSKKLYASITDLRPENINREFTAVGYIKYTTNADALTKYVLVNGDNVRTIAYIAQMAIKNGEDSEGILYNSYVKPLENTAVTYKENVFLKNADGTFNVTPVEKTANINSTVIATAYDNPDYVEIKTDNTVKEGVVLANGSLELNTYYAKKEEVNGNMFANLNQTFVGNYKDKNNVFRIDDINATIETTLEYTEYMKQFYGVKFSVYQEVVPDKPGAYVGNQMQALIFDAKDRVFGNYVPGSTWSLGGYGDAEKWYDITLIFDTMTWGEGITFAMRNMNTSKYVANVQFVDKDNVFQILGAEYVGDFADKTGVWKYDNVAVWKEVQPKYNDYLKTKGALTFKIYQEVLPMVEGRYDGAQIQPLVLDVDTRNSGVWAPTSIWNLGVYGNAGKWYNVTLDFGKFSWGENKLFAIYNINTPKYITDIHFVDKDNVFEIMGAEYVGDYQGKTNVCKIDEVNSWIEASSNYTEYIKTKSTLKFSVYQEVVPDKPGAYAGNQMQPLIFDGNLHNSGIWAPTSTWSLGGSGPSGQWYDITLDLSKITWGEGTTFALNNFNVAKYFANVELI